MEGNVVSDTRSGAGGLLLISPVYNECTHIEVVVRAMAKQQRPPDLWLVVDDNSSDGTYETLQRLSPDVPFMRVLRAPPHAEKNSTDRLALAYEAVAFNYALSTVDLSRFAFVGKLDGDIELAPEHFAVLLGRLESNPDLGLVGCTLIEPSGGRWIRVPIPQEHVHGAVKLYRSEVFLAIGGIREYLGWDVVDELFTRMQGKVTHSYRDVQARHHRPSGSADGQLRGRARGGRVAYMTRQPIWWVVPRSAKVALSRPYLLSGAVFLGGYIRAAFQRQERLGDVEYARYVRRELRGRVRPHRATR